MNWITHLEENNLEKSLQTRLTVNHAGKLTYEEFGNELAMAAQPAEMGFGLGPQLWEQLKTEFHQLICEKKAKYDDLRKRLNGLAKTSTPAIVAVISSHLGTAIGLTAAVVSPLVTLLLLAVVRLGVETFCGCKLNLDQPILAGAKGKT